MNFGTRKAKRLTMPRSGQDRLLKAALKYGEFGWPVFPIKPRGKTPLTLHGFLDATRDRETIESWWGEHPDAGIGVPTGAASGIVVLDVDGPEAEAGLKELDAQIPTRTNLTGKGAAYRFPAPRQAYSKQDTTTTRFGCESRWRLHRRPAINTPRWPRIQMGRRARHGVGLSVVSTADEGAGGPYGQRCEANGGLYTRFHIGRPA